MVASSSAFSFHCMICFDEFDSEQNYPVVLPCGHTYVCVNCASRLDQCMECRTPLEIKMIVAAEASPSPMSSSSIQQRRQQLVQNRYYASHHYQPSTPPTPSPTVAVEQRLPLPKNAVLLSLIQASEPAARQRRRSSLLFATTTAAEESPLLSLSSLPSDRDDFTTTATSTAVEVSPTTTTNLQQHHNLEEEALLESPPLLIKHHHHNNTTAIKTSRSRSSSTGSLLFPILSNNHSSSSTTTLATTSNNSTLTYLHSSPQFQQQQNEDDNNSNINTHSKETHQMIEEEEEEYQIQIGINSHNGACGTYAVVDTNGLLVYPTLIELLQCCASGHSGGDSSAGAGNGRNDNDTNGDEEGEEERAVRDDNGNDAGEDNREEEEEKEEVVDYWRRDLDEMIEGSYRRKMVSKQKQQQQQLQKEEEDGGEEEVTTITSASSMASTLRRVFHSFISDGGEDAANAKDDQVVEVSINNNDHLAQGDNQSTYNVGLTLSTSASGASNDDDDDEDDRNVRLENTHLDGSNISLGEKPSLSFTLSSGASLNQLDIKGDGSNKGDNDDVIETERTRSLTETSSGLAGRHISVSSVQMQSLSQDNSNIEGDRRGIRGGSNVVSSSAPVLLQDESKRPLLRLKYGDRVQVVSSDPRGWVKLARGYGYIRLENDKQLVKVGGTNDRACQIESTLHELSIERDRLKYEQIKLERLSAGLMIDLQSTILTSDDHVICSPPKGFLHCTDSDLCDSRRKKSGSLDDIITRAKGDEVVVEMKTPSSCPRPTTMAAAVTARSHSPSRKASLVPTSQPQSIPTRIVNWRTGLSGHRALSSHSHPHDFIGVSPGGTVRSMSNHNGVSKSKSSRPRASIY